MDIGERSGVTKMHGRVVFIETLPYPRREV